MPNYTLESSTVETLDGVNLMTRIFKPKQVKDNMVIVLVHQYSIMGGCQALMKGMASGLADKGYAAVTFDMRGAPIAGSAVDQIEQIIGYVSLGYPFGMMASILFGRHHKAILQSPKPKLFVMGTEDGFTSVKQLDNKLKSAAGHNETRLIEGAGHFEMEGPAFDAEMVKCILEFIASL
ncbi:Carboxymethylenebutenolidase [Gossypium arboreum]|uniref:Carboxymethylenebutenolidase n=1 Tax=Gossypium arboreum TaxID=29729 RepID=A0A0B0N9N9_GOSAR|nr:Carboxymethylenebutenolidase [Gossypium arboreum]